MQISVTALTFCVNISRCGFIKGEKKKHVCATLIFKHKPLHCCVGNNDILCEQSVDMQFGAMFLILGDVSDGSPV